MIIKDVLGECLVKMGMENFISKTEYSEKENGIITDLIAALNIVYREIVCEYLPLVFSEEVELKNGEVFASELAKRILYPIRLYSGDNVLNFKVYPDKIAAGKSGVFTLEYAYVPDGELTIDDSIDDMRLTSAALSDGTLAEYYFKNKVFELARDFDASFRNRMGILRYKGRRMRMKQRGWQD